MTNATSQINFGRILVSFKYIGLFHFRNTAFYLNDKISGDDFGMGKFLIWFGIKESMFFVNVTVLSSVLLISKDNKAVVKSIYKVSF